MRMQQRKKLLTLFGVFLIFFIFKRLRSNSLDWEIGEEVDINAYRSGSQHDKWIVVTTVQSPTEAVRKLAAISGWKLVVVGDRTTPKDWKLEGVTYLSPAAQKALGYHVHAYLPYDSYTRKIIGYLYAIEHGAQFIYETDDDNYMDNLNIFHTRPTNKALVINTRNLTFNPYPHFGQASVWPRGYPLDRIGGIQPRDYALCSVHTPAVQQGLVNGDPDVDAIFRMTRKYNGAASNLNFDANAPVLVLPQDVFAPYNSQNTFYTMRAFWSLLLFTSVSDRETDIYRSYWAQKLMWLTGSNLAFFAPTSVQKRNSWHENAKDARDETRLYTHMGQYVDYLSKWSCSKVFFFDCMTELTADLVTMGFIENRDAQLAQAWADDLAALGYGPPLLKDAMKTCYVSDEIDISYYPWEQNTSMGFTNQCVVLPLTGDLPFAKQTVSDICGIAHQVHLERAVVTAPKFDDVLLVVSISDDVTVIPALNALYKINFPHIIYCGNSQLSKKLINEWKVTYLRIKEEADALICMNMASKMHYHVTGYLHITQNTLLQFERMHVSSKNKHQVWVTGEDLYVFDESVLNLCGTNDIQCTGLDKGVYDAVKNKLNQMQSGAKKLEDISKCLIKAGADPTFKVHAVTASKELTFYLPVARSFAFHELAEYFMADKFLRGYSFLAIIVLECLELAPEYLHGTTIGDMAVKEHYDYVFPFLFKNVQHDAQLKKVYCDYIEKS